VRDRGLVVEHEVEVLRNEAALAIEFLDARRLVLERNVEPVDGDVAEVVECLQLELEVDVEHRARVGHIDRQDRRARDHPGAEPAHLDAPIRRVAHGATGQARIAEQERETDRARVVLDPGAMRAVSLGADW
jgi:hypothetical protein